MERRQRELAELARQGGPRGFNSVLTGAEGWFAKGLRSLGGGAALSHAFGGYAPGEYNFGGVKLTVGSQGQFLDPLVDGESYGKGRRVPIKVVEGWRSRAAQQRLPGLAFITVNNISNRKPGFQDAHYFKISLAKAKRGKVPILLFTEA